MMRFCASRGAASSLTRQSRGRFSRLDATTLRRMTAGNPNKHPGILASSREEVLDEILEQQKKASEAVVPWFLQNMPPAYFRQVPRSEQIRHLLAASTFKDILDSPGKHMGEPELTLRSEDDSEIAFLRPGGDPDTLLDNLEHLPPAERLSRVKVYSALDNSLFINTFRFGEEEPFDANRPEDAEAMNRFLQYCQELRDGKYKGDPFHTQAKAELFEPELVKDFLHRCNRGYVLTSNPRRLAKQIGLYHGVIGTEGTLVDIEDWEQLAGESKKGQHMVTVASANVLTKPSLEKHTKHLSKFYNLKVLRAHLDVVGDPLNGEGSDVTLMRLLVAPKDEGAPFPDLKKISRDLRRMKWLDDRPINLAQAHPERLDLDRAEAIYAYSMMLHNVLAKEEPHTFALGRIFMMVEHPNVFPLVADVADLFMDRFDPSGPITDEEMLQRVERIKADAKKYIETPDAIRFVSLMAEAVAATLRSNAFLNARYALALRMDPAILGHGTVGTDIPYGVFFVHGRRFNGFHVRFRDISRGGLRVVAPANNEEHLREAARQYNECYSLAYAQQLKNKDIPEGGSKAVVLVEPNEKPLFRNDREFVIRKSVKAFCDSLLDLNTTHQRIKALLVDHYGQDELIYLGPDENIIPDDITWITKRAAKRGYPIPSAFMSSKPDAGINHKVYGVTSEGVAVFADVALHAFGHKPREQPFTVKITGGPDGDVAGNMIKILNREYGQNAKIVGISDGSGCGEDPNGLDHEELLRLFREGLPIVHYSKDSSTTSITPANTPEGIRLRNSMHNRIKADLFVPAGGRPGTINSANYRDFIGPNGEPSSKLVVEGANLYITPEARQLLFEEAGVVFVKDSSANKCGVICSSYEIMASMLLESEEFLSIKNELVEDVLEKLRQLARVEAQLLFRAYNNDPTSPLPPWSERISRAVTRTHDAVLAAIDDLPQERREKLMSLVEDHLPTKLKDVASNRIAERVPWPYVKSVIAASLASRIVYREGIAYAETLPDSNLANIAFKYLEQENRVKELIKQVEDAGLPSADEIADLLNRGGVRAGIDKA